MTTFWTVIFALSVFPGEIPTIMAVVAIGYTIYEAVTDPVERRRSITNLARRLWYCFVAACFLLVLHVGLLVFAIFMAWLAS